MKFNIIKNTFGKAASEMHILKVENDEYDAVFYYYGDYLTDKNNGQIRTDCLTLSVKPKHENIAIKYNGELYLDLGYEYDKLYNDAQILELQGLLEIAREARTALLPYLQKILNGEEI